MCSELAGRQLKGNIRVHQWTVTDIQGSQNLRSCGTKVGAAFSPRLHLAFFESQLIISLFVCWDILSSGNSYLLLSFTLLAWASGRGKKADKWVWRGISRRISRVLWRQLSRPTFYAFHLPAPLSHSHGYCLAKCFKLEILQLANAMQWRRPMSRNNRRLQTTGIAK